MDKGAELNPSAAETKEDDVDLPKRVPKAKKADWIVSSGPSDAQTNVLKKLMEQNDVPGVQKHIEEWQKVFCDLEEANGDYQPTLDIEQLKEDSANWVRPRFAESDQFRDMVQEWVTYRKPVQTHLATDILDREPRWYERGVKEAIYERIYNPTLNRKGGLRVELSSTWDPALPPPKGH
ncbi:hypothetical protein Bbelb_109310 [Branchiostoma belcheri]|nr:hypothetical protein Bbelb_109310 [Branchiostoma belcheri]